MLIEIPDPPRILALRSSGWGKARDEHVLAFPACAVCWATDLVEVHHVRPYYLFPELELDPKNLMTLCRVHHFWWGHLGDWSAWNPSVREDAETWREKIRTRSREVVW